MGKVNNIPKLNQRGMVSIVITMVIMLIISLIVISFARVSRREQRQALDRQLNSQAFYAAETGVNDALRYLDEHPDMQPKEDCTDSTLLPDANLDATGDTIIGYSCILIDPYPDSLQYDTIGIEGSKVVPIQARYDDPINKITVSWQGAEGNNIETACEVGDAINPLPKAADWRADCPGMLRLDLVPIANPANFSRQEVLDGTMTAYLFPKSHIDPTLPFCVVEETQAYKDWKILKDNHDAWSAADNAFRDWQTADARRRAWDTAMTAYNTVYPQWQQRKARYDDYNNHMSQRPWYVPSFAWSIGWSWYNLEGIPSNPGPAPTHPGPQPPNPGPQPPNPGPEPPKPGAQPAQFNTCPPLPPVDPDAVTTITYTASGADDNTGFPNQGQITPVDCGTVTGLPYMCNLDINVPDNTLYVLRLRSIYRTANVSIVAQLASGGTPIEFKGAQAVIDVTGKANDVLRRINVRAPISELGNGVFPDYAVLSVDTLCKRFGVAPGLGPIPDPAYSSVPECQVNAGP